MGQVLQVLPRGRMTVCVSFGTRAANRGEDEVIVEDMPSGQHLFRASSRADEPRVWQILNDSDQPRVYRILARHRDGQTVPDAEWVANADKLLFANPVTRVIGYGDGRGEQYGDPVATVTWH